MLNDGTQLPQDSSVPKTFSLKQCPYCSANIPEKAVLCTNCGRNLKTGKKLQTTNAVDLAPSHRSFTLSRSNSSGCFLIILCSVVIAGIYFLIKPVKSRSKTAIGRTTITTPAPPIRSSSNEQPKPAEVAEEYNSGEVLANCRVNLTSGQAIPVQGWLQMLSCSQSYAEIQHMIDTDSYVRDCEQTLARFRSLNRRALELGVAPQDTSMAEGNSFNAIGNVLSRIDADVVSEGALSTSGKFLFPDIPPGTYILYGAGMAGNNAVGFFHEVKVREGKRLTITPVYFCYYDTSPGYSTASWGFHGSGSGISQSTEWQAQRATDKQRMKESWERSYRENQQLRREMRARGLDPDDLEGNMEILKRRVEGVGLRWPGN